ncbi:MAG: 50S ribosomal protein L29 [Cytophagaceae bacterium SCN 52-12]|nr:MAG: 50S ribosomal protein L29 [Cytophagaceae bacterium SCN 52-12]
MKKQDIKGLSLEEIQAQVAEERERLLKLKFANAVSPIENPLRIKASRKHIARLLTEATIKKNADNA